MLIKADIHIHTCLSPCADIMQSPKRIAESAFKKGLNLIFITDHNTIENTEAAMKAGRKYEDLKIYPGMEITSREEVHTLALFENLNDAGRAQEYIYKYLPGTTNIKEYENQVLANESDEVEGYLKKSLFSAADIPLEKVLDVIHDNNGLAIAAHIDRESFSVISQLGFIPESLNYDALELSPNISFEEAGKKYPEYANRYMLLKGSDAHSLHLIGTSATEFEAPDNTFKSLEKFIHEGPVASHIRYN
ncbi:MAG: PHP domain-containing protein [Ignavibacteria bacterium]